MEEHAKLLRLKGLLNRINHISYTYSQLGKTFPMNTISDKQVVLLIQEYERLLEEVKKIASEYE